MLNVSRQVGKNLQRQVSERLLGALDPLTRIRLGESDTQVFAQSLQFSMFRWLGDFRLSRFGKGFQITNALAQMGVVNTGFETELVLDGEGVGNQEVQGRTSVCC